MKRIIVFITLISLSVLAVSCKKEQLRDANREMTDDPSKEIVIGLDPDFDIQFGTETKATAISSIPSSLYWGASTGTLNTGETSKWAAASATVSSSKINTGKYQTVSPTTYNLFVANQSFSTSSNKTTMTVANNNTDVIYGKVSSNSSTPSITLDHIFARTGSLTLTSKSGYTDTATSWSIVGKGDVTGTAGTFNLSTGTWTSRSSALSSQAITSSSDLYLLPGVYTISVTFTHSIGDYTSSYTRSADVTLVAGKINNITAVVTGPDIPQIQISLSLTAWSSNPISVNLPA